MGEYRISAHAVFDIKYHIVWITKYRCKILRGRVAERARDLLRQICQSREVVIVRGAVSPDHIHMLVSCMSTEHGAGETGAVSEGPVVTPVAGRIWETTIKKYIESQRWDDEDQGFKITAPTEP
jgi:Transposase IS200 like